MNSKEALDKLVGKTTIMNDTCASLEDCIKGCKCRFNEPKETCEDYKLFMIIKQDLDKLEILEKQYQELKELVEFLIKHLYVATELLELRVAPKHNHRWDGWRHNGIKVQNDDFWKHIKLIDKLKKEIGNYE